MILPKIPDKFSAKFNLHFYDRNFIRGFYKQKINGILRGSGYKIYQQIPQGWNFRFKI